MSSRTISTNRGGPSRSAWPCTASWTIRPWSRRVLWGLGNAYYFSGDNIAARDTLIEDVRLLRNISDPFSLSWALHTLGLAYSGLGETVAQAQPLWREALEHFAAVGDISGITILLGDFAILANAQGDPLRAVRLNAASDRLATSGGTGLGQMATGIISVIPDVAGLDPAVVEAAAAEGGRMTVDQAVAYALKRDDGR